jgi:hypothetical protein
MGPTKIFVAIWASDISKIDSAAQTFTASLFLEMRWHDTRLTHAEPAVTSMLTLIAYRFAIGSEVPKLPYLTRLDAFILASSVLVFLSLIEVMVTTRLATDNRTDL